MNRLRDLCAIVTFVGLLAFSPLLYGQTPQGTPDALKAVPGGFDPHDLEGPWIGYSWHTQVGPGGGPGGLQNYASFDQRIPEPPLTDWAKKNLMYKSISHDSLEGTYTPGWDRPGHFCPSIQDPCYSADQHGVPVNDLQGEYPARDCEPLSDPAIYDYPGADEMEFTPTADGTRIYQFFEYHHEWRTFWLNRDHPKGDDLDPTFLGDSVAHWEGNTLVVDTTGFNGKTMISQSIAHSKSDAFRLVERFTRVNKNDLVIEMTLYDPKAWGDKFWPGFVKYYHKAPASHFREFICSPRDYQLYEKSVIAPADESIKKMNEQKK